MSAPSPVTAAHPSSPSRSRSREGSGAGSSGHPDRRSQRASEDPLPARLLDQLTRELRKQRAFRLDQLAQMDASQGAVTDPARREVDATLREAAALVLVEIDAALRRIASRSYGRCRRCGDVMSVERLMALPMATWCGSCHYKQDLAGVAPRRSLARRGPAS